MCELEKSDNKRKKIKCPEFVSEEQIGATEEELQWALKKEARPPLPRAVFITVAALLFLAFIIGGTFYYRTNILPEKYYQSADSLFKQEKYDEATKQYLKVLKLRPERKDLLFQIAYCHEKIGKSEEAVLYYEKHIEIMANDTKAAIRLGWLYFEKGEYEKAFTMLENASKRNKKNPDMWNLLSKISIKRNNKKLAIIGLSNFAKYTQNSEEILIAGKALMELKAYKEALVAYNRYTEKGLQDSRGEHGALAAKIMMGHPADMNLVIIPGESIGPILLNASKKEVKEAVGRPDIKRFTKIEGKSKLRGTEVEIWAYSRKAFRKRAVRIFFVNDRVLEVESRSDLYKTEKGIGLSNFLLTKNLNKMETREEVGEGVLRCLIKEGGLTFYAKNLNEDGSKAKHKKFRLHKGKSSIENMNSSNLNELFK